MSAIPTTRSRLPRTGVNDLALIIGDAGLRNAGWRSLIGEADAVALGGRTGTRIPSGASSLPFGAAGNHRGHRRGSGRHW